MRALVVYCHPKSASFTAAVRDRVTERLEAAGAELLVLLVPLVTIGLIAMRTRAIPSLFVIAFLGALCAVVFQGAAIPDYRESVKIYYLPVEGNPRELPF